MIKSNLQEDIKILFWTVINVVSDGDDDDDDDDWYDLKKVYDRIFDKICNVCKGKDTGAGCYMCRGKLDPEGTLISLQTDLRNILDEVSVLLEAENKTDLNRIDYAFGRVHEKMCESCKGVGNRKDGCYLCW